MPSSHVAVALPLKIATQSSKDISLREIHTKTYVHRILHQNSSSISETIFYPHCPSLISKLKNHGDQILNETFLCLSITKDLSVTIPAGPEHPSQIEFNLLRGVIFVSAPPASLNKKAAQAAPEQLNLNHRDQFNKKARITSKQFWPRS